MKTIVFEDGSLERQVKFVNKDSSLQSLNLFGISQQRDWEASVSPIQNGNGENKNYEHFFKKSFNSCKESNIELFDHSDTLFKVESSFEKKFRWFYTYITFNDRYKKINRFTEVSSDDYFVKEDYLFMRRLPPRGKSLSQADSIALKYLSDRIFDEFATRGMYEHYYVLLLQTIDYYKIPPQWKDSVEMKKELIYDIIKDGDKEIDTRSIIRIGDSLGIPFPADVMDAEQHFSDYNKEFESRLNFMSTASETTYVNSIEVPWEIINTNADSVVGKEAFWQPRVAKFLLDDYSMTVECRRMNIWVLVVTLLLFGFCVYFFILRNDD